MRSTGNWTPAFGSRATDNGPRDHPWYDRRVATETTKPAFADAVAQAYAAEGPGVFDLLKKR